MVTCIKKMGSISSPLCNELAKSIWTWAIRKQIWLSSAHIPGVQNVQADHASRNFNDNIEFMLQPSVSASIMDIWGKPDIDMFASRLKKQLDRFVSRKNDPEAESINVFSLIWSGIYFYALPPFSLILRMLSKPTRGRGRMYPDPSYMDNRDVVSCCHGNINRQPICSSNGKESVDLTRDIENTSVSKETSINGVSLIRQNLQKQNISAWSSCIIMASWRPGTQKQYNMYIRKWFSYCHKNNLVTFKFL